MITNSVIRQNEKQSGNLGNINNHNDHENVNVEIHDPKENQFLI